MTLKSRDLLEDTLVVVVLRALALRPNTEVAELEHLNKTVAKRLFGRAALRRRLAAQQRTGVQL